MPRQKKVSEKKKQNKENTLSNKIQQTQSLWLFGVFIISLCVFVMEGQIHNGTGHGLKEAQH